MNVDDFIRALTRFLPSWAISLAQPVIDRLLAVYAWAYGLGARVAGGWRSLRTGVTRARDGLIRLPGEVFTTFMWLVTVRIPAVLRVAINTAVTTVTDIINRVRAAILAELATLRRWATDAVNGVLGLLGTLRRWVTDQLNTLISAVRRLLGQVFGVWATPERLAEWLIGALWARWWRYASDHADEVLAWLWARRQTAQLRAVAEVEQVLGRLL
jgi:hypothetical protein